MGNSLSVMANNAQRSLAVMAKNAQQSLSRKWDWGAFGVAVAGAIQVSAGVYMVACTPFSAVGFWLMSQGGADIVFSIRTGVSGTFSWENYLIEKLVSIVFTALSGGIQLWIIGSTQSAFMKWSLRQVSRTILLASARGGAGSGLGEASKMIKERILKKFPEKCEKFIGLDRVLAREFDDTIRVQIEDLFRLDPANARDLILAALEDVKGTLNEDNNSICDKIINAVVENLGTTAVELGFVLLMKSKAPELRDRVINCAIFVKVVATSVMDSRSFAMNFMSKLQKAIATRHQRLVELENGPIPQPADPETVQNFIDRFKQRIKLFIVKKATDKLRGDLVQACNQTLTPAIITLLANFAGI